MQAIVKAKEDFVVEGSEEAQLFTEREDKVAKRKERKIMQEGISVHVLEQRQGIPVLCKPVIVPFIASLLRGRQLFSMVAF